MSGTQWISARCPACGGSDVLFVADGGYITCSRIECPNPEAAHKVLESARKANMSMDGSLLIIERS